MEDLQTQPVSDPEDIRRVLQAFNIDICDDLEFLSRVALSVEYRTSRWRRRTVHGLSLALEMNRLAQASISPGLCVDPNQLAAACLAHDFGMGFLPIELLEKPGTLNATEKKVMRTHIKSATDLIHRLKKWPDAREMIANHHERLDGSGYPGGRRGMEIPSGARILAIVDAFTAQGNGQVMHGVMEINRHTTSHFCAKWVEHFNVAARKIFRDEAA